MTLKVPVTATQTPSGIATWNRKVADAINSLIGSGGAVASASYVPLVTGAEPPVLVSDGAGGLIFVPWSP